MIAIAIIASIALCLSIFVLFIQLDIIKISKSKVDKFEKYRDSNGLLKGGKNQ